MARNDPIVEEIHAVREMLAREANYDLERLLGAARKRQYANGLNAVWLPPREPAPVKKSPETTPWSGITIAQSEVHPEMRPALGQHHAVAGDLERDEVPSERSKESVSLSWSS